MPRAARRTQGCSIEPAATGWLRSFWLPQNEPGAPDGVDQGRPAGLLQGLAEIGHSHVNHVCERVVLVGPDVPPEHLTAHHLALPAKKVNQHLVFTGAKFNRTARTCDSSLDEVHRQ